MPPKTRRRQDAPQTCAQQATSVRKSSGSQRAQTRATMTTEYQERFLPPHCHTTVVSTSGQKAPYHPLKGTSTDTATFRSCYVTHKWIKNPPKAPQPPTPPKGPTPRCSSAPHAAANRVPASRPAPDTDYTSIYKSDFQAWTTHKRQPYRLGDSLRVSRGLVVTKSAGNAGRPQAETETKPRAAAVVVAPRDRDQDPQPFESVTSYRSDFVKHPAQPRVRGGKPASHAGTGLPLEPAATTGPKLAWQQELLDGANDLFQQFKAWSLENKLGGGGRGKAGPPPPPAGEREAFLSTTHADYTPHTCPRTRPILPSVHGDDKSKEPLQSTTTMREDYRAWDTPRRLPAVRKEEWPKRPPFSVGGANAAEGRGPPAKPPAPRPAPCNGPEGPPEGGTFSGYECISSGAGESRVYWSASLDRGVTWADRDDPSQPRQIISCMVSSRS